MPQIRLAANVSMLFREHAFADRFAAAAEAGFPAVECQHPYEVAAETLARRLKQAGIPLFALNTPAGETFGTAAVPGRAREFREGFELALAYAQALGAGAIHVMSGAPGAGHEAQARTTFFENLRWAAARAGPEGPILLIEPLNTRDRPGYFVSRSDEVVALLEELALDRVKLMFDAYHI